MTLPLRLLIIEDTETTRCSSQGLACEHSSPPADLDAVRDAYSCLVAGLQFFDRRNSEITAARRELATTAQGLAQGLHDTVRATAQLHYGLSRARDLQTEDKLPAPTFSPRS